MPDAAQYTLGLFDTTALVWTVAAPATASGTPSSSFGEPAPEEPDNQSDTPPATRGSNYSLNGDRSLARGWPARARDNIAAIALSKQLEDSGRVPTREEQDRLVRFVGFGATELAQNCFPLPGASEFRPGWEEIGQALAKTVTQAEYAALQRATQYAHYTPEPIIRALWRTAEYLGFAGGRVLEPGMGTGLFFALLPEHLRGTTRLTGVEYDPITARIARLIHLEARVRCEDYTRTRLGGGFDLAIGNPPFADRIVRADSGTAALGLRLHDYFIARSISRLRPGGIALFVSSTGTMDKVSTTAREHIAGMADLVGAVRLPEGVMGATAGTDVVIDVLIFQRRPDDQEPKGYPWLELREIPVADTVTPIPEDAEDDAGAEPPADHDPRAEGGAVRRHLRRGVVQINEYFADHPEMVLGEHGQRRGIYGPGLSYTCRPRDTDGAVASLLDAALTTLPPGIVTSLPDAPAPDDDEFDAVAAGTAAEGATIKEGSFLIGKGGRLCQILDATAQPVAIKQGRSGEGITPKAAKIIRALLPIRDAVRDVLRAQATGRPWASAQVRLRCAYSGFIRYFGPINHTVITTLTDADADTGEEREVHRRPNLAPFGDDPDCWLVASIGGLRPRKRHRPHGPDLQPACHLASDAAAHRHRG
jgi:adenine-specific DNA methylase